MLLDIFHFSLNRQIITHVFHESQIELYQTFQN